MRRILPVTAVVVAAALAGCGSSGSSSTSSSAAASSGAASSSTTTGSNASRSSTGSSASTGGKGTQVSYISPVASQPGQQEVNLGLEAGAKQLGWSETVYDANLSPDKQVQLVQTAINQKRNALASWTLDPGATAGAYTHANSAGIPVIGMNSAGAGVTNTVWWENVLCSPGGTSDQEAKYIAGRIPHAQMIIIGGPPAPSIVGEVKCFTAAAKKAGLDIIETQNNTADTSSGAQTIMQTLVTQHPGVQVVWCYNDQSALGVSAALISAGKKIATATTSGVIVLGHNGDTAAIQAIKDGRMTGTWDPNNIATGMAAIKAMQTALQGGVHHKYTPLVVKGTFYTSANISSWKPASQISYSLQDIPLLPYTGGS